MNDVRSVVDLFDTTKRAGASQDRSRVLSAREALI